MKDFPVFTTQNGVSSIVLREVPFQLPRMLIAAHRENNNSPIVRNFMNLLGESR